MSSSTAEIDDDEIIVVESSIEEEVDCWENERFYPFVGFSSRLLPTDRYQQSDITGTIDLTMSTYPLPPNWAWIDAAWRVDKPKNADKDGWFYALDFSSPAHMWHGQNESLDTARRRRLVRRRAKRTTASYPQFVARFGAVAAPLDSSAKWLGNRWMSRSGAADKMRSSPVSYEQYVVQASKMMARRDERAAKTKQLAVASAKSSMAASTAAAAAAAANAKSSSNEPGLDSARPPIVREASEDGPGSVSESLHQQALHAAQAASNAVAALTADALEADTWDDSQLLEDLDQIERDIGRTEAGAFGIPSLRALLQMQEVVPNTQPPQNDPSPSQALRRVLTAYACRNVAVGYVQGLNFVVRLLLALTDEKNAFWLLATIVEDMRLPDFYSRMPVGMAGLRAEISVLRSMFMHAARADPKSGLGRILKALGTAEIDALIETSAPRFLIPLFLNSLPLDSTMLVLDRFFIRQLPPAVESRLDTPLFDVFLVMLNGVADDIIEDEECRTHIVFTKASTLTAVQLWELVSKSHLIYPDPVHFNQYLTAARASIVDQWLHSEAFNKGDFPGAFTIDQLEDVRDLILPLAAQYKHKAKLHDFKKPANSAVAIALSSVAPMHAASNTAAKSEPTMLSDDEATVQRQQLEAAAAPENAAALCWDPSGLGISAEQLTSLLCGSGLLLEAAVNPGDEAPAVSWANSLSAAESSAADSPPTALAQGYEPFSLRANRLITRLHQLSDVDQDGECDLRELLCLVLRLRGPSGGSDAAQIRARQQQIRLIFQVLDENCTGFIERDEALAWSPVFRHLLTLDIKSPTSTLLLSHPSYSVSPADVAWVDAFISLLDHDCDDRISFVEFQRGILSTASQLLDRLTLRRFMPGTAAVCEEVWENQRYFVIVGWTDQLLPTDRPQFSDLSGTVTRSKDAVSLPEDHRSWTWADEWHVDGQLNSDSEGWSYAVDFSMQLPSWGPEAHNVAFCRRRRWIRHRICLADVFEPLTDVEVGRRHVERLKVAHNAKLAKDAAAREQVRAVEKKQAAKVAARLGF